MIEVVLSGPPIARREPEIGKRGERYTLVPHRMTERGLVAWRVAWQAAGSPMLPPGPVFVLLELVVARPATHVGTRGRLTAAGRAQPVPTNVDADNAVKLCADALKRTAFPKDDAWVGLEVGAKRWADAGEEPRSIATLGLLGPAGTRPEALALVVARLANRSWQSAARSAAQETHRFSVLRPTGGVR